MFNVRKVSLLAMDMWEALAACSDGYTLSSSLTGMPMALTESLTQGHESQPAPDHCCGPGCIRRNNCDIRGMITSDNLQ